ncbi:hypothetical protein K458DRAFT_414590 [Lentithecium fluviatile CBS 122367]|uniref:Uncharacterized protein n=1 Tax=Lentithecium fluviatile CBS 122367 TaxID=1168545 RepID=A0A6G1JFA7_9PLEO|nr:hypothetical protein K458DRAFT_414590 [Lentithecium fluviatile CBS 122367]
MAMAAFNVFSIVLGVATMIPFLGSMMPGRDPLVTTVRIYAGTGDDTNGNAPHVAAFDIDGNLIGSVKGGDDIAKGAPYDAKIEMKADGSDGSAAQAEYISLSQAGVDAICVAGISVTWPDGLEFAWYGDVGEFCGAPWYHSTTILSSKDLYKPKCVWIDGDATNGIKTQGIGIHIPSFVATAERAQSMTDDKDLWCNVAPRIKFYDSLAREQALPVFKPYAEFEQSTLVDVDPAKIKDSANWFTPEWALDKKGRKDNEKRTNFDAEVSVNGTRKQLNFQGQLIKSGSPQHSAKVLCESDTSLGPDFVSEEEGIFCDMDAKRAWPLCTKHITNNCFDNDKNQMVGGKKNSRRDDVTGERILRKRYETVKSW